jgi:hypothetical protein
MEWHRTLTWPHYTNSLLPYSASAGVFVFSFDFKSDMPWGDTIEAGGKI